MIQTIGLMKYSPLLFLFTPNSLPVIELLTFFLTVFLSIYFVNKKMIALKYISINLTVWLLNPQVFLCMLLLSWTLVSKTILSHPYLICTFTINLLPKPSTMQFMSWVQKPNYSLSGVVSAKLLVTMKFQKSLSSLTQYM